MNEVLKPRLSAGGSFRGVATTGIFVIAVVVIAAAARQWLVTASRSGSNPATVSQQAAESAAWLHVPPDARLLKSQLGIPSGIELAQGDAADLGARPDENVWVVTFSRSLDICQPDGKCLPTRSGYSYVVLDATTGDYVATYTYAAP